MNIDGDYLEGSSEGAVAAVCRDHHRRPINGFARSIKASSAAMAEATALVETLKHFLARAGEDLEMETDLLDLIRNLADQTQVSWSFRVLISEAPSSLGALLETKDGPYQ
ncbi:uncharacterized protein J3R85_015329 [Psidium guajava]|nr:uncharacterized protein J3R85_015329 [Psidium guajava]